VGAVLVGALIVLAVVLSRQPAPPPDDLFAVLPSADGHTGAVVVERADGERVVLDKSYASIRTGESEPTWLTDQEVRTAFAPALAALPEAPARFLLYFETATDQLTEASKVELARMLAELKRRAAPDILVIGHTDRVGSDPENDRLSLQRAERVKGDLAAQGIRAERITASGRGEREPLVPTADGVDEPRNRRVEINVR
jgi:outer membrane protein OmpA-like peptidoglycan-associated protein